MRRRLPILTCECRLPSIFPAKPNVLAKMARLYERKRSDGKPVWSMRSRLTLPVQLVDGESGQASYGPLITLCSGCIALENEVGHKATKNNHCQS